jgi:hypothetical protein
MVELNLTIDDELHKLNIPSSWDDMNIKMYEDFVNVRSGYDLEKLNSSDALRLKFLIELLCKFVGEGEELIQMIYTDDLAKVLKPLDFVSVEIEESDVDSIIVDNDEYFLKKDFSKLNLGEMTSLNVLAEKYDGNIEGAISEMLCIFLRKKKENGKLEAFRNEFMDRAEMFRDNVLIKDVHSLFVFFLNGDKK